MTLHSLVFVHFPFTVNNTKLAVQRLMGEFWQNISVKLPTMIQHLTYHQLSCFWTFELRPGSRREYQFRQTCGPWFLADGTSTTGCKGGWFRHRKGQPWLPSSKLISSELCIFQRHIWSWWLTCRRQHSWGDRVIEDGSQVVNETANGDSLVS